MDHTLDERLRRQAAAGAGRRRFLRRAHPQRGVSRRRQARRHPAGDERALLGRVADGPRAVGPASPERRRTRRTRTRVSREPGGSRLSLSKRVAVVTGASSGIGEALARRLARDGWHLVLVARREDRLSPLASELGGEYEVCDVTDRESVERMAAAVGSRHERVHLLANNAGIPGRRSFLEIDTELLERVLRTNYLGGVWCLRAFLGTLEAAAPDAHVVNVVSVAGTVAFAPSGPYSAAKHAQLAFSRATAAELAPRGIRVHTILPGFVETEGFPQRSWLKSRFFRQTVMTPDRVADAIADAIGKNRGELFVPRWYRVFALGQALAPGLVARAARRSGYVRRS
jgi:uncharacterized protein